MKDDMIPHRVSTYMLEEIDGEMLLYGAHKTQAIYINETAALIFRLCDGQRTVGDIRQLLQESYPEKTESIAEDVGNALQELSSCGAIEIV